MPDDLSQVFDPEPAELPVKKPRRRKLPVEAEAPSSDTSPPDTPRRGRRKATEPTPDGADAPVPDESEKPRRRRSRSTALAPGSEQQPSDAAAAVAEPAIDVFVTEPEPASAHADLPDELHDTGKNRTAPLADDSAFDEAAVLDSANDAVLANYADPPAVEIEFSDPVEDAATAAAAAPDERLLAERLDEGFRAAEVEPMEPAAMEDDFSLPEDFPLLDDAEFSDALDAAEPAETAPPDPAFSLAEEAPLLDDTEFSGTFDDGEPAAAPRFHDSANEEPVPSTSDAEAAPFDAAFSLAEEDPVLDDAEFSQVLDDAEPAAAPGIYEVAPTDYAQAVATAPTPAPLSVAEEAPRLDAAEFADPLGAAGTVDAAGLNRDVPTAEEPPADPVEAPRLARAEPVEATSAPSDGSVIEDVSLYRETPPLQAAAQAEERPFREEFAAQDFPPPISGMATPEQAPIEPDEPLVLHQALPSDPMPGIPNRNSAAEVPQDIPLQSPPLILDENEPDGAEQEELSMPRPLVAEPPGDAHREPTIASTTTAEATAEMSSLSPGPLTEPPDNGPPLMPLDEAAATDGETAQGEKGATSSKAWGPVRGAIETAMANIGPLLPISRAEQLRRQVVGAVRGQFAKIAGLADSLVFAKLPWLKRIGALVPRRRSTLIGGGLLMAAVAGGAGVRLLLSNVPAPPPAPVLGPPSLPSHVARRLGQELEMSVVSVPKGPTELFATGEDQLDSALALSRREAAGDGIVISLDALAGASRRVLAWYGLGSSITVKPSSGPTLTFQGDVPDALYPLAHAALDNIGQLLGRDPVLKTVQIRDQIAKSDTALLRAIFIGSPKSIVYTTDGAREIGESLYGDFTIKAIDPDSVVLAPAQPGSKITVTVPLREPSAATVEGPPLAALPDRSAVVLMQQPRSAKE